MHQLFVHRIPILTLEIKHKLALPGVSPAAAWRILQTIREQ
jgi:hypothetical protein